jgi:hypothetical protein
MAWPGSARKRSEALGAIHRSVGEIPGLDPWGRPWDVQSEGRWNLENPPDDSLCPPGQERVWVWTAENEGHWECKPPPVVACPELRYNMPGPAMPGCPVEPGSLRYLSRTVTIPAGGTGTFKFTCPGIFCPQRMMVMSDDIELMFITKIASGTKNQLISGIVPATFFGTGNTCCPISCLDCICAPGVWLEVQILNTDVSSEDVTVILIGTYYDIPPGMTARQAMKDFTGCYPGCPIPGTDKLVGISESLVGLSELDIEIETPGRFCPKHLFFQLRSLEHTLADVFVTSIRSPINEMIVGGRIPATMWSIENKCCILSCFDCLCVPGVPMTISLDIPGAEGGQTLFGVVMGDHEDVC